MGIKTVKYKSNSIVYFKGDAPNRVYILKKGSIVTKSKDLKSNEDILTMIKVGEFIGVKNVISNQPYSETVSTLTDSELVVFYKEDFEAFILSNNRIMMQTLVVFSNQLRKIHKDIKELNDQKESSVHSSSDPEENLYELGRYFLKQHKVEHGNYCFKKYNELYPNGKYINDIKTGSLNSVSKKQASSPLGETTKEDDEDIALFFQEGENYMAEENYGKAHECFSKVLESQDGYHKVDALYFNGACLYKLKNYKQCIQNYSTFLSKHKDYNKINEVMFYVGSSYKELGDLEQSKLFLKQVMKRAEGTPLSHLALKELKG
ncbi:cyclic nucleotide-binding domain-containing protein [Thiospirochaeta perfilievii]|uniref:Cyclic nucleotide-binding domain-containing protein n=1 Tax=Thiospirochaeta perfilievii TaxID=252967 RepID=A0A5C1QHY9_9SPIO|nr:cyclic nucleotide-binding domain-containing protein [Thiospirochaeta perfilievii]QEN06166.1 cyclic nucleotide-binding domain-containing protein [Thiospirochaeta perfilievii]